MSLSKTAIIIMVVIGIIVLIIAGAFLTYAVKAGMINLGFKQKMAQIDNAEQIIDKTYDAENAIYNYEWFKTQHEKIGSMENQINNTKSQATQFKSDFGNPQDWDWQTKQEYSRITTTLLGQKNQYENLVADYNARSKMANREIFQDSLPFDVDKKIW